MKATYRKPPYSGEIIKRLEDEFLKAALVHAGSEDRLRDIYNEASKWSNPSSDWNKLHDMALYSALWRTGASHGEHGKALFILEGTR